MTHLPTCPRCGCSALDDPGRGHGLQRVINGVARIEPQWRHAVRDDERDRVSCVARGDVPTLSINNAGNVLQRDRQWEHGSRARRHLFNIHRAGPRRRRQPGLHDAAGVAQAGQTMAALLVTARRRLRQRGSGLHGRSRWALGANPGGGHSGDDDRGGRERVATFSTLSSTPRGTATRWWPMRRGLTGRRARAFNHHRTAPRAATNLAFTTQPRRPRRRRWLRCGSGARRLTARCQSSRGRSRALARTRVAGHSRGHERVCRDGFATFLAPEHQHPRGTAHAGVQCDGLTGTDERGVQHHPAPPPPPVGTWRSRLQAHVSQSTITMAACAGHAPTLGTWSLRGTRADQVALWGEPGGGTPVRGRRALIVVGSRLRRP